MARKQVSALHIYDLTSVDAILLGSNPKLRFLVINLVPIAIGIEDRQLVNPATAQSFERCGDLMEPFNMGKLLFFIPLIFFYSCKVDKRDFYLPANFEGEVAIVYVKNAVEPTYENGRQKIIIPDSGIVFINQPYTEGAIDYRYFIGTSIGYSELDKFTPGRDTVNGENYIYFERTMGFDFIDQSNKRVNILAYFFYVGKQLDSTAARNRFFFENRITKILKDAAIN